MSKQAWRVVGLVDGEWKIVDEEDAPIVVVAYSDDEYCDRRHQMQRTVADHNALLDISDPEAFMAAHRKLVEACEKEYKHAGLPLTICDALDACPTT